MCRIWASLFVCSKALHKFPIRPTYYIPFSFWIFSQIKFWFSEAFWFFSLRSWTMVLAWHRVLYQYGFLKILLLNKVIEIAILIFSHIWWGFPLKLLLLVDYTKHFCWTSSSFTGWSPTEGLFICLDCLLLCVFLCFFFFLASLML